MKLILKISLACLLATGCASKISAQTYVKLNGLYALVGVVNPAVEFTPVSYTHLTLPTICSV